MGGLFLSQRSDTRGKTATTIPPPPGCGFECGRWCRPPSSRRRQRRRRYVAVVVAVPCVLLAGLGGLGGWGGAAAAAKDRRGGGDRLPGRLRSRPLARWWPAGAAPLVAPCCGDKHQAGTRSRILEKLPCSREISKGRPPPIPPYKKARWVTSSKSTGLYISLFSLVPMQWPLQQCTGQGVAAVKRRRLSV